ncbi:hypothetical protein O6H91_11G046500 [Diphasiastrum complanatum]|uniref:Uncharacterized protein n=1 Tax=Diphasiastrum complanatum TaxID=34168 RepID=A0ACC2C8T4_DIPCM|nr:hypothetical protein O6H91_11G046500 [Diphasiastrum complanatum]
MEGGVAVLGLGPIAHAIATTLIRSGFIVRGFDVSEAARKHFNQSGGNSSNSLKEAVRDAAVVVVTDHENAEYALCGPMKIIQGLCNGAVLVIISLLPPTDMEKLEKELLDEYHVHLVDALVCGGVTEVSSGTLTILAAGTEKALDKSRLLFSAICKQFYVSGSSAEEGSKLKMVNQLLVGVHIAAAAEAMALGASAGINTKLLYDIISNAAGSSWMFNNRVPHMLNDSSFLDSSLNTFVRVLSAILSEAKKLRFPLPLAAAAQQQFLLGSSAGYGLEGDHALVKIWHKVAGIQVTNAASAMKSDTSACVGEIQNPASKPEHIAFIGLGAMGCGMATWLVHEKFSVCGYDVYEPSMSRFQKAGGEIGKSPEDVVKDAKVVILMVTNESQVESALYGDHGAIPALQAGCTVMVCSTVSPDYVRALERRLIEEKGFFLVDAPVSGGVVRAANGALTMMASGKDQALKNVWTLLSAMSEKVYITEGGVGAASTIKMVNQLLAGVHIAVAAEGMAFGARLGLNTRKLFNTISKTDGCSWMFLNRVPHMLDADYTPYSALDIFVKDLGIVLGEGTRICISLPLAAVAHQQFLLGSSAGWGREDDAAVVKVFEKLGGVKVAALQESDLLSVCAKPPQKDTKLPTLSKASALDSLPPEWPQDLLREICEANHQEYSKVLVVLDDDPTGTQTVHGITVLTEWSVDTLVQEFHHDRPGFFILTNSRALSGDKAFSLVKEVCQNVSAAAALVGVDVSIVLRGDSTLRGHFPQEAEAATSVLGKIDAWIICPFFLEGGRFTIGDIHYVAEGNRLVPAGQTEFAQDPVFGYKSSNLCEWVEEKTEGRVLAENVVSISIETIRGGGPQAICERLCGLAEGSICIVNSASERDIAVFAAGVVQAEAKGKNFLCRTAAAFVSARMGIQRKAPLGPKDVASLDQGHRQAGGLIVVGSHVPKTTKQVEILREQCRHFLECITVNVVSVATASETIRNSEIVWASRVVDKFLAEGKDTLVMTSRELIKGNNHLENLEISSKVSSALVEIVQRLNTRPRYLLAKGGITSSDLATKAMGSRRAEVVGQACAGVPLWTLGPESRHSGVPYIVFPGNVGETDTLANVVKAWARPPRPSMKELLLAAEGEGYALGAFNVYNLEGAMAVIAAAESENSPAILQIHPAALAHGGVALTACCLVAAKQASVPIIVHLDHATEEHEVVGALQQGFDSVMVDGSHLSYGENVAFTKELSALAHAHEVFVEAELGRLSGTEDGLTVEEYEARLTDPNQAKDFIEQTQIDALAICIGNVHGKYPLGGPKLDIELLKKLREITLAKSTFLVLHGASGLPVETIKVCIELGCRKFNVNTELRAAYLEALKTAKKDLVEVMSSAKKAMEAVIVEKLRVFGSSGKAGL